MFCQDVAPLPVPNGQPIIFCPDGSLLPQIPKAHKVGDMHFEDSGSPSINKRWSVAGSSREAALFVLRGLWEAWLESAWDEDAKCNVEGLLDGLGMEE